MKEYEPYLRDVLDRIAKRIRYVEGYDLETFSSDEKTTDAVIRNIEVIGEASDIFLMFSDRNILKSHGDR